MEEVEQCVRAGSEDLGKDPDLAEKLWRILIDWLIAREELALGNDRAGGGDCALSFLKKGNLGW